MEQGGDPPAEDAPPEARYYVLLFALSRLFRHPKGFSSDASSSGRTGQNGKRYV